ncbi:uncharacterized protein LAESUDRAFT_429551 [Laetiporus sulphureus 93-53]|uniref:Uncharacterized protein n=1 Tax=Laetiporus sulphureus 93-53 TaxID=1314785 RepID=A0A165GM58_9APHY|nr:uncharacterized protein LAESUDRAFT_429551 [Laetiporus sulphureus 93-53]KZT10541.1 hypothetical protein LAESUDRAFT_429551 [Laetiporus sulphureus 93-53]
MIGTHPRWLASHGREMGSKDRIDRRVSEIHPFCCVAAKGSPTYSSLTRTAFNDYACSLLLDVSCSRSAPISPIPYGPTSSAAHAVVDKLSQGDRQTGRPSLRVEECLKFRELRMSMGLSFSMLMQRASKHFWLVGYETENQRMTVAHGPRFQLPAVLAEGSPFTLNQRSVHALHGR